MPSSAAVRRAPPIEVALRVPKPPADAAQREKAMLGLSRRMGMGAGSLWALVLWGILLWLGRVPWPEALAWSAVSGAVAGRGLQAACHRWLRRWCLPCTLELGPPDAPGLRARVPRIAARYGYHMGHHALHGDVFRPRWGGDLLPPLRVAWSGPGACIEGPRILVRAIAARAVDPPRGR